MRSVALMGLLLGFVMLVGCGDNTVSTKPFTDEEKAKIKAEDEAKLKVEADVLAKEVADAKAKSEAIAIAKAKAKEDARVQVLEARKAAAAVKDVAVTPANAGAASVQNVIASKTLEPKDKAGESPSREKREHSAPKP